MDWGSNPLTHGERHRWVNGHERVWRHRQPLAELDILCLSEAHSHPSPSLVWCLCSPNLPQMPGVITAPTVGWSPVEHTVYRETLCNHVVKFVLPRIQALKCQRPSPWLQAHHMTPQGWRQLSPRLSLALSERLHCTKMSSESGPLQRWWELC